VNRLRIALLLAAAAAPLVLEGCMRGCQSSQPPVHLNRSMFNQPKYKAQAPSAFFYDGRTMRMPVAGTVARGQLHDDVAFWTGKSPDGSFVAKSPLAADEALLARGAERFTIYCQPCHDERGEGKGILFQRANVPTANLLEKRIGDLPDGQVFDVITNGKGLMQGYRYPIGVHDRWAIVAHVRKLESSQTAEGAAR
jgi:mono/diheme cytochrome c family protein